MAITDGMDPELLAVFAAAPQPDRFDFDVAALRAGSKTRLARFNQAAGSPRPDVARTDTLVPAGLDVPEVPVRVYEPTSGVDSPLPGILFIHGGGFVAGGIEGWDFSCERLVVGVNAVVVSAEYRLPPEHPFPAGIEDCYAALRWLFSSASELGVDPARVAVVGESSGGGLAAALALLARDRGEVQLAFQMPLRACLDDRLETASSHEIVDRRTLHRQAALAMWGAYLGDSAGDAVSPYAAAGRATDLAGLPPAYLAVGQLDLVRDENLEYARRLIESGVRTEFHLHAGAIHNFENVAPHARISADSLADQERALVRALHPAS